MKKNLILLLSICLIFTPVANAAQWRAGTTDETIKGTTSIKDIDSVSYDNIVAPLDRLLSNYKQGCRIVYSSVSQITVESGEIVASNAAGTIRLMLKNSSDTTVTWTDIDTGAESASTTYYIYAGTSTASDTTITFKISANSTTPTGLTYYKRLGSFYNNSSSNITLIQNDGFFYDLGDWTTKSLDTTYQALTDGFVVGSAIGSNSTGHKRVSLRVDTFSPPTTMRTVAYAGYSSNNEVSGLCCPVKKGDYYKLADDESVGVAASSAFYFVSTE